MRIFQARQRRRLKPGQATLERRIPVGGPKWDPLRRRYCGRGDFGHPPALNHLSRRPLSTNSTAHSMTTRDGRSTNNLHLASPTDKETHLYNETVCGGQETYLSDCLFWRSSGIMLALGSCLAQSHATTSPTIIMAISTTHCLRV